MSDLNKSIELTLKIWDSTGPLDTQVNSIKIIKNRRVASDRDIKEKVEDMLEDTKEALETYLGGL